MKDVHETDNNEELLYNSIDGVVDAHNAAECPAVKKTLIAAVSLLLMALDKESLHHPLEIEAKEYEKSGMINLVTLDIY
jgi:hypothetical protein